MAQIPMALPKHLSIVLPKGPSIHRPLSSLYAQHTPVLMNGTFPPRVASGASEDSWLPLNNYKQSHRYQCLIHTCHLLSMALYPYKIVNLALISFLLFTAEVRILSQYVCAQKALGIILSTAS